MLRVDDVPDPRHPVRPTPDDALVQRIGNLLLDVASPRFRRIDVLVHMTVAVQDLVLTAYIDDGTTAEVLPPDRLTSTFGELRTVVAVPDRGTWFSVRCVVDAPSRIDLTYVLDHEPPWMIPVPDTDYVRDLLAFPRDDAYIPDWLHEKITGEPASAPLTRALDPAAENRLLGSATTLLVQHLPGDWSDLVIEVRPLSPSSATIRTIFGRAITWQPPPTFDALMANLRDGMDAPGGRNWRSARFHLAHPNRYTVEYHRDEKPARHHAR